MEDKGADMAEAEATFSTNYYCCTNPLIGNGPRFPARPFDPAESGAVRLYLERTRCVAQTSAESCKMAATMTKTKAERMTSG